MNKIAQRYTLLEKQQQHHKIKQLASDFDSNSRFWTFLQSLMTCPSSLFGVCYHPSSAVCPEIDGRGGLV
jgi:hypothetical protein